MRRHPLHLSAFRFLRDSTLMVNAGALSGLLFLLVHPILGRRMSAADYATFVQVLGVFNVLGVPASAGQAAITRYVAEYVHGNQLAMWVTMFRRAARRLLLTGGLALVVWLALSGWVAKRLEVPEPSQLMLVGIAAFISLFLPIVFGSLQGAMYFGWLAAATVGLGCLRLLLTTSAVALHNSVNAALVGVNAGIVGGILIGCWPMRRILGNTRPLAAFDTRPIYRYLWPVLLGQGALFLLVNADLILAARLLAPDVEARYMKVAMLSRTVLFLAQPIAAAMFPRAVTSGRLRVLLVPLAAAFGMTLAGALGLFVIPNLPMRLMYGVSDPGFAYLTRLYVWAALPHAMAMFIAQYLWARHRPWRVLWLLPVLVGYLAALPHCAGKPEWVIAALAIAGWLSLALMLVAVLAARPAAPAPGAAPA